MPSSVLSEAEGDTLPRDGYLALSRAYAALGLPERARGAFAHARASFAAIGHHMLLGATLLTEFDQVLIPYYADHVSERRRTAADAEAAYAKAGTAAPDQQPRIARVPLLILEGDWATARKVLETMPQPLEPFPGLLRVTIAARQGDVELAWQLVHETFPDGLGSQPGDSEFSPSNGLQRLAATLALDAGDLSTARAWLEAHDRWLAGSGAVLGQADGELSWAIYHRAAGEPEAAHTRALQALNCATAPRQPLVLLAAHRLLGELATIAGLHEDAARYLDTALALADACAAPYERALTLLALAELRAATGQPEEARQLLDAARALCEPLDAKPALARAEALAARLASEHAAPPKFPAGLSSREVEVLMLLAAGRTNREIAATLSVSVHTVNTHVKTILGKTGSANRVEAAAFAHTHGLT
jgi:DNA-binding CsgD family transcriptional regulator